MSAAGGRYTGFVIVVENPRNPLSLEYSSDGDEDDVTVRWDGGQFAADETVTLYIHDMGQGLDDTQWGSEIVVADNIRASGGSCKVKATTVYGKSYKSGCFFIRRKAFSSGCGKGCRKERYYCPVRK